MERKKLTLVELSRMYNAKNLARAVNSGVRGTKDNPYTKSEVDSLIDKGKFKGGYFIDDNGLVSYCLGTAEIVAYNSASEEDFIYDFNSDFYVDFCNSYYNSDSCPFGTSESSINIPYADGIGSSIVGAVNTTGSALDGPKKINYGSNGRFYFETRTGRVFCGNQYVGTTSLNGIGQLITKYVGKIDIGLTVYNVCATYCNDGFEAGNKEAAVSTGGIIGGETGSFVGRWAGTMLGAKVGVMIGSWTGPIGAGIGGVIGGIIGGVGGDYVGSHLVEITIE